VDVDNFKKINDTAGHVAGDNVLRLLAKIMQHNIRATDIIIARYGGDEFVLLMLETKISGAKVLLERLRRHVKTISLPKVKSVTVSCGLAEWDEGPPPDTAETILKRADDALYEAKHSGRNRVVTSYSAASPK
jgi:diguanylate cyclase (GGDEF)-like protein